MTTIDFSPLYRNSIGFDRLATRLDNALRNEQPAAYPPYDIEVLDENRYSITLAVAGFNEADLDIQIEKGILTVRGKKFGDKQPRQFLYQGIANRSFERKFSLADHVEVNGANLDNGLLTIKLNKQIPEAMKPKSISINTTDNSLENKAANIKAA